MVKGDEGTKLLYMLKPAMVVVPEVETPDRKTTLKTKMIWTGVITLIYLLCCQIPIYGINKTEESDPFYWMRVILASNRGSLMELGISPLVTSSMIMQLLSGAKLLKIDQNNKEEKELFEGAQKLVGVLIAFGQAFAYTWSGMYGNISEIGAGNAILIVLQLTVATIITIMLDDMMSKGYGIGNSGTSLFIAINISESVLWKAFSPLSFKVEGDSKLEGAFVSLFYGLIVGPNRFGAVQDAFFRSDLPNINNVIATVLIFCIVIYFQGFKINIPLSSTKQGAGGSYPIKLFYTSNMPIILQTTLVSNLYFFSQMLHRSFRGSYLIKLLGNWQEMEGGQSMPVGGLIYFLTPPRDFIEVFRDPIHTIIYIIFVIGSNIIH
jgi:protein transport protein SEC61 subunit alpha